MARQINLLDAGQSQSTRIRFNSVAALCLIGFTVVAVAVSGVAAHALGGAVQTRADATELEIAKERQRGLAATPALYSRRAAELTQLRALEADRSRLRAAIDSGMAGHTTGYAAYLAALSRQATAALWLTGFSVGADGRSLEIVGRMTSPSQLPGYLRRLNAEPLFSGREFAELTLKTGEAAGVGDSLAPGYVEFALRSVAAKDGNAK